MLATVPACNSYIHGVSKSRGSSVSIVAVETKNSSLRLLGESEWDAMLTWRQ